MKRTFFIKKLTFFLIPLMFPLLISGVLSIKISKPFIIQEIDRNNYNLLKQVKENIELAFSELDSLSLHFNTNPEVSLNLKKLLKSNSMSMEETELLRSVKNIISAPANARPYIHSIYVYYDNNKDRFLTTNEGITNLDYYYDIEWYNDYQLQKKDSLKVYTKKRTITQYSFEEKPYEVLSIYRWLISPGSKKIDGVIVLNIRSSYINNLLSNLKTFPDQCIFIIDKNNEIIAANGVIDYIKNTDINHINQTYQSTFETKINGKIFSVFQTDSGRYDYKYVSIVPHETLYQLPIKLSTITFLLLILSLILSVTMAYYFAKKDYSHIYKIYNIVKHAESNKALPPLPTVVKDEYDYITSNILKTFIEQSYIKLQLSEKKYRLESMQLLALQSQINPHFLFNTLETISWKVFRLTGGYNEANKMIENLSDILKYSLQSSKETVRVEEEIHNAKSYIDIQRIRYKNKFSLIWDVDEECMKIRIISMLLQPLIENSIYHGIKEKVTESLIKIRIARNIETLKITVIDNGLGMNAEDLKKIKIKLNNIGEYSTNNIGLLNTYQRLKLAYGEESKLTIRSKRNLGTVIHITIPIKDS